jgi:predicted dehydrogenase
MLNEQTHRKLLMLLTVRGTPVYMGMQQAVASGRIGEPVFTHVRMAVRLKREERPPWFLDSQRSGGLFLDLLIHGLDALEWITGHSVVSLVAQTGNLDNPEDPEIRDHASVYCRMDDGSTAIVEGQRMLPDSMGSDYRVHVAGTQGFADLDLVAGTLRVTDPGGADAPVETLPEPISVVADWLDGGIVVPQSASLRANRLALLATASSEDTCPREVPT